MNTTTSIFVALLLAFSLQPAIAQEAQTPEEPLEAEAPEDDGTSTLQQFGGPASVPGQLADDERLKESLTGRTMLQGYFDWKDRLREEHGVNFSSRAGCLRPGEVARSRVSWSR